MTANNYINMDEIMMQLSPDEPEKELTITETDKSKAKIPADIVVRPVQCIECVTNKQHKHNGAMVMSPHILKHC